MTLQAIDLINGLVDQLNAPELLGLHRQHPFLLQMMNHPVDVTPAAQLQPLRNIIERRRESMHSNVLLDEFQNHSLPLGHLLPRNIFFKNIYPTPVGLLRTSDLIFRENI
jgi:hypothetical protein